MNIENIMRSTMLNLQQMFCAENGIEYVPTQYEKNLAWYKKLGFSDEHAPDMARLKCDREKEL